MIPRRLRPRPTLFYRSMPPMQRYLTSRNSSMPYFEPSRPMPLSFMPERGDLGRDDALVDADDTVFEGLGDASDAPDVAAVEIGGEAELGVVGHLDGLGVGLEAV